MSTWTQHSCANGASPSHNHYLLILTSWLIMLTIRGTYSILRMGLNELRQGNLTFCGGFEAIKLILKREEFWDLLWRSGQWDCVYYSVYLLCSLWQWSESNGACNTVVVLGAARSCRIQVQVVTHHRNCWTSRPPRSGLLVVLPQLWRYLVIYSLIWICLREFAFPPLEFQNQSWSW